MAASDTQESLRSDNNIGGKQVRPGSENRRSIDIKVLKIEQIALYKDII